MGPHGPFKFHNPHADLQLVSVQLESSIALALPVECDFPHASTHEASVQPFAHARNAAHSEPRAQSFFAASHLPEAHAAQRSALGVSGTAASTLASSAPPSGAASVPASLRAQVGVVCGAPVLQVSLQSVAHVVAQVRESLQEANAT